MALKTAHACIDRASSPLQLNASGKQSEVGPVQDVSGDDAMGSAEPGAELREEDVGADGQQQSLLLDEAIAASIWKKNKKKKQKKKKLLDSKMCQCVRLVGK